MMRRRTFGLLALGTLAGCAGKPTTPPSPPRPGATPTGPPPETFERPLAVITDMLRTGGISLYLSHPGATSAGLGRLGRMVASEIGEAFEAIGVSVSVATAPEESCRDTAAIAFPSSDAHVDELLSDLATAGTRADAIGEHAATILAQSVEWGEVAVFIGHRGNIEAATGVAMRPGEGLICARAGASFQVLAKTMPNDWARMR